MRLQRRVLLRIAGLRRTQTAAGRRQRIRAEYKYKSTCRLTLPLPEAGHKPCAIPPPQKICVYWKVMRHRTPIALAFLLLLVIPGATSPARAQAKKALYPAM